MIINLNDLIGKPFHEDGYGPDNYSCYGLAVEVYKRYGILIPKINISVCVSRQASQKEIDTNLIKSWKQTKNISSPTGIVLKSSDPAFANHLGVYIGRGKFIHITINRSVVIDRISDWKHKIIGYYHYIGESK